MLEIVVTYRSSVSVDACIRLIGQQGRKKKGGEGGRIEDEERVKEKERGGTRGNEMDSERINVEIRC